MLKISPKKPKIHLQDSLYDKDDQELDNQGLTLNTDRQLVTSRVNTEAHTKQDSVVTFKNAPKIIAIYANEDPNPPTSDESK